MRCAEAIDNRAHADHLINGCAKSNNICSTDAILNRALLLIGQSKSKAQSVVIKSLKIWAGKFDFTFINLI